MPSLVQKAKERTLLKRYRNEITKKEVDLALAWAKGELGITQVAYAVGTQVPNAYRVMAFALAQFIRDNP